MNYQAFYDWVGILGLIGLLGFLSLKYPIPKNRTGGGIRNLGLLGLLGLAGIYVPPLAASGAFGALALWNHPIDTYARLARLGWFGLVGPMMILEGVPL